MDIVAEADFNYDEDKEKFGTDNRLVRMNCFTGEGEPKIGISFNLGLKPDDTMNLIFPLEEMMSKLSRAIYDADE